jgi:polysaccharide pyruvyl transferase WcaK-like protein
MNREQRERIRQAVAATIAGAHPDPATIRDIANNLNELIDELEHQAQTLENESNVLFQRKSHDNTHTTAHPADR